MVAKTPQHVREEQLNALPGKRFVRWADGAYGGAKSKAVMRCASGHEFAASVTNLIANGRGCPECSKTYRYSARERIGQLNSLSGKRFVRWVDGYKNQNSKAVMQCDNGHEWSACVSNLVISKTGCPRCAGKYIPTSEDRRGELEALPGKTFVRWLGEYIGCESKAVMRCDSGHEWSARVNHLINKKSGCPTCAKHGFNPYAPSKLYALRSECGQHVKIGITGHLDQRIAQLKLATPFEFVVIATVDGKGRDVRELETMFHVEFESSGFNGFDGATEWLTFNPQILSLLRILGA